MDDTSPERQAQYYELLRRAGPEQRAKIFTGLCRSVRELAMAGIRKAHGEFISEHELRWRLSERLYGREIAERFFDAPAR